MLKKTMDTLAEAIAAKASEKDTPLQERIDAFKALTAYYAAQQKRAKKSAEDEPDEGGFSFSNEAQHGNGEKVRARRTS